MSPNTSFNSARVLRILWGASKKIIVDFTIAIIDFTFSNKDFLCPGFLGGYPKNKNLSVGKPDWTRAVITDDGPGTDSILIPSLIASLTSLKPGSDTVGVPASETKAIFN